MSTDRTTTIGEMGMTVDQLTAALSAHVERPVLLEIDGRRGHVVAVVEERGRCVVRAVVDEFESMTDEDRAEFREWQRQKDLARP